VWLKVLSAESLDKISAGETVLLVAIHSEGRSRLRLAELGLNPEATITVVKSEPGQPVIIRVRDSLLAIDRQTARHLRVHPLDKGPRRIHHGRRKRRRFGRHRWRP
jgi:Fe2+ transport system protein FeoA